MIVKKTISVMFYRSVLISHFVLLQFCHQFAEFLMQSHFSLLKCSIFRSERASFETLECESRFMMSLIPYHDFAVGFREKLGMDKKTL